MTWASFEPTDTHDQYLFYLNAESGRLEIAEYTIRDIASSVTGVTQFEDFEDFDGILLPTRRTITFSRDDSTEGWVQRTTLLDVTWDEPGVEAFEVDDGLPSLGDEKLSVQ